MIAAEATPHDTGHSICRIEEAQEGVEETRAPQIRGVLAKYAVHGTTGRFDAVIERGFGVVGNLRQV